ncbi:hypothetical protein GVN21_06315 [Caulobacter sp. SLTY]|uniref:hypothetical protein n=1 Tax=Caulobacter sp. SLTY TaxID=2683262 RepID=UPI0014129CBA|nr:hypothetical protein [Caulobacter sp. SLTY]NBB14965.1 hypothetical protein [Caulobacter sp. SLTY]
MRLREWLILPAFAMAVMVINVAISFAVVWVYSLFEPGHPQAFYNAFALKAAPVSSVLFGIPLMFLAGFFVARKRSRRSGLIAAGAVSLLYTVVDIAMLLGYAASPEFWFWGTLSYSTKIAASLAGGWAATRRTA